MNELLTFALMGIPILVIIGYYVWRKYFIKSKPDKPTNINRSELRETEIEDINEFQLIDTDNNLPVISLQRIESSEINNLSLENVDSDFNPILAPILQQLPMLAKNVGDLLSTTYSLKVNSTLLSGLNSGKLELMQSQQYQGFVRGTIVDPKTGKIVGQGNFKPASGINPATTALIVWQIMAVITAQKFLSDINKKLEFIKAGVEQLISFQKNEWWGKIYGNIKSLMKMAKTLDNINSTDAEKFAILNQLESIERENYQALDMINKNIDYSLNAFLSKTFKSDLKKFSQEMKYDIIELLNYQKMNRLSCYSMIISNTLKNALPVDKKNIQNHNNEIREIINELNEKNEGVDAHIFKKIPDLKKSFFDLESLGKKYQSELKEWYEKSRNGRNGEQKELLQMIDLVDQKISRELSLPGSNPEITEYLIEVNDKKEIFNVQKIISDQKATSDSENGKPI